MGLELLNIFRRLDGRTLRGAELRPVQLVAPVTVPAESRLPILRNFHSEFQARLLASLSKGLDAHKQRALDNYGINIDIAVNPDLPLNVDYQFHFNEPSDGDDLGRLEISPYFAARLSNQLSEPQREGLLNPRWSSYSTVPLYYHDTSDHSNRELARIFDNLRRFAQPQSTDRAYKVIHDNPRDGLRLAALEEFKLDIYLDHETRELLDYCEALPKPCCNVVRFADSGLFSSPLAVYYGKVVELDASRSESIVNNDALFTQLDLARANCAHIYGEETIAKIDKFIGYDPEFKVAKDINSANLDSVIVYSHRPYIAGYKNAKGLLDRSIAIRMDKAFLQMPFYRTLDAINRQDGIQLMIDIQLDPANEILQAGEAVKLQAGNFHAWSDGDSSRTVSLVLSPEACRLLSNAHSISPELLAIMQETNRQFEDLLSRTIRSQS